MSAVLTCIVHATPAFAACAGADPNDWEDDTAELQSCLNAGVTVLLDPGSPGYIVNGLNGDPSIGLILGTAGTNLTSSQAPTRATIRAGRDLFTKILQTTPFGGTANFSITYISFDGMVDDVWEDGPYRRRRDDCYDPREPVPYETHPGNLMLESAGGSSFTFSNNESTHALCGSGLGLYGTFNVQNNYIAYNGRDEFSMGSGTRWSDGMTVLYCNGGYIAHNTFVDNTDLDLALGGGSCFVELNVIAHFGKYGFAGLNVGNLLTGPAQGNHAGSTIQGNSIYSGVIDKLAMGILIGSHPWQPSVNVAHAGSVVGNTSHDNVINMVIDGVANGNVSGNNLYSPSGSEGFGACAVSGKNYTVNTNDVGFTPQAGFEFLEYHNHNCQQ